MPIGVGKTDFLLEADAPVKSTRCLSGPTEPRSAPTDSAARWRFLNQLSLNYLPLVSEDPQRGAMALRRLLELHCAHDDGTRRVQIAGVREVSSASVTRRLPGSGPMCFGRGLQLSVTLDEESFEGADAFLLGAVLQAFFATYVTVNHSVETVVRTLTRGEIMRWPPRTGLCEIL
jgi:type VI secretion system protein ImpG